MGSISTNKSLKSIKIVRMRDNKVLFETNSNKEMETWVNSNIKSKGGIPYFKNSTVKLERLYNED